MALLLLTAIDAAASSVAPAAPCTDDAGCSLNGRCKAGVCECLDAWSGPSCAVLNLLPAAKGGGLHAPHSRSNDSSSWGGSVGFDEASGRWQMFAAEMVNHCGIGSWEENSRIVRASSATPTGEYTVEEQIKPPFAHEPVLQRLTDGRWLLYSIGNATSSGPPRTTCSGGYSPSPVSDKGGFSAGHGVPDEIYVTKGAALGAGAGWETIGKNINPLGVHSVSGDINPAPLVFANGSVVMMWRGGDHWYDIHLAHSEQWDKAPYSSKMAGSCFTNIDMQKHGAEDPFMYKQPWPDAPGTHSYHAIFHDHSTFGGHACEWQPSEFCTLSLHHLTQR